MILIRTTKTFYTVRHAALGAELTEDYHERTSIFGYNAVTGMVGGVGFGVFLRGPLCASCRFWRSDYRHSCTVPRRATTRVAPFVEDAPRERSDRRVQLP